MTRPSYVSTPCVKICRLDVNDVCIGCLRTLAEIGAWPDADVDTRRQILRNTDQRIAGPPRTTTTVTSAPSQDQP